MHASSVFTGHFIARLDCVNCFQPLIKVKFGKHHHVLPSTRVIDSLTEPALGLLPVMVGMAKWSLSQEGFNAQQIEFLNDLYSPASQAMTELVDGLRGTHTIE